VLCTDATVDSEGSVIGDPTEAAFVVLAAKMGRKTQSKPAHPCPAALRCRSTQYKFMATFHDVPPRWLAGSSGNRTSTSVKGAPDVVLERCGYALWHGEVVPVLRRAGRDPPRQPPAARERGLRVLDSPPATWMTRA
jgi:Ca2+-transporting ATPase